MELITFDFSYNNGRETTRHILRAENEDDTNFLRKLINNVKRQSKKSELKFVSTNIDDEMELIELEFEEK